MARKVQVATGLKYVQLPDGGVYNAGAVVTLTNTQFATLPSNLFPGTLVDQGYVDERPLAGQAFPSFTTAARPVATTVPAGWGYYDTTLGKPVWGTGTAWKDAAGTTV